MTNRIISNEFGYSSTYAIQQKILDFLIDNVDNLTIPSKSAFNKNTIISEIDLSHKTEIDEKILGVSGSNIEYVKEGTSSITLKKYIALQSHQGYKLSKLFSYQISIRLYNIYQLDIKRQKKEKKMVSQKNLSKLKTMRKNINFFSSNFRKYFTDTDNSII